MTGNNDPNAGGAGGTPKTLTEEQLNAAAAEKERDWQVREAELKKKADEWDRHDAASKSEIQFQWSHDFSAMVRATILRPLLISKKARLS